MGTLQMKSFKRRLLYAGLATLTLCAIASASASASACTSKAGSKNYQLCLAGNAIEGTSTIKVESRTTAPLALNLGALASGLAMECGTVKNESAFVVTPGSALAVRSVNALKGCKLVGNKGVTEKCIVPEEKEFATMTGTLTSIADLTIASAENGKDAFLEWPFTTNPASKTACPAGLKGTHAASGQYECTVGEAKVEAVEHELTCTTTKEHMVYLNGAEEAPLSYKQVIFLTGSQKGKPFSIYEAS
jgi:hypothetical protein